MKLWSRERYRLAIQANLRLLEVVCEVAVGNWSSQQDSKPSALEPFIVRPGSIISMDLVTSFALQTDLMLVI